MDRDIRPDDLRTLAAAARVDADWVARAKAALIAAPDAWEPSEGALIDDVGYATYCGDEEREA